MKKMLLASIMFVFTASQSLADFEYVLSDNCSQIGAMATEPSTNLLMMDKGAAWFEIEYFEGRCNGTHRWWDGNMRGGVAECELGDSVEEQVLLFVTLGEITRMRNMKTGDYTDLHVC